MSTLTSPTLGIGSVESAQSITLDQRKLQPEKQSADVSQLLETVSGQLINPTDPAADAITIEDIAWALSRIPRFAGHTITEVPYNVAQHSVYVSKLLETFYRNKGKFDDFPNLDALVDLAAEAFTGFNFDEEQKYLMLVALLHDAHEAYLGDIPSPVKKIPELREAIHLMELKFDLAICNKFGIVEPNDAQRKLIKFFDKLAQAIEGYQFMRSRGVNWNLPRPGLILLQDFPPPKTALCSYQDFMQRFQYLTQDK